jgi:hypothetical protein
MGMGDMGGHASAPTYPLEIHIQGVAVSDNAYKDKRAVRKGNRNYIITKPTPEAILWRDKVQSAVEDALAALPAGTPPPNEWPLPIFISLEWIHQRIDASNGIKATSDFLAPAIGVDDRFFEYDGVRKRRKRGKTTREPAGLLLRLRPATPDEAIRPRPTNIAPLQTAHELPGDMTPGLRDAIARATGSRTQAPKRTARRAKAS